MNRVFVTGSAVALLAANTALGQSFVNWETPHVSPLAMTPDGAKLLVVNTADNRLEVFSVAIGGLTHVGSIEVGLDPVSVRARTNTEAWVVNHVSDSVSIVDLPTMRVLNTISVGDEPADVAFAAGKAFVSLSQLNQIKVYDQSTLAQLGSAITLEGEDPRALATDGTHVYAAIFESGNRTSIIAQTVVSSAANPYAGDANPPPNNGTAFSPLQAPGNPAPPAVSLIVKKNGSNWLDDNQEDGTPSTNWNSSVPWNLHDHDVAVIDANSLAVSYVNGLMNLNMQLAVKPGGQVAVVGTDAINHKRFEPNVGGIFVRVMGATFPAGGGSGTMVDLNPHLDYLDSTVDQSLRDQSIGDPRGIAWNADGTRGFITGMGSNNVIVADGSLNRIANVDVGQGPTGVVVDVARDQVYVLNKFDATITVLNQTSLSELDVVSIFDPTPLVIKVGRPHLYDTHATSGLGQASCASCHIDGRIDQLAWDLGNPAGNVIPFDEQCQLFGCENPHPMKGPMTTQTLIGIIGTEPFHWRGDRDDLFEFNPAFMGLLGDDTVLTGVEMQEFEDFLAATRFPPQPNRNIDNSLQTSLPVTGGNGNAVIGENKFMNQLIDGGLIACNTCHTLPTGTNGQITPGAALQETQSIKIPQLRNLYEKTGLVKTGAGNQNSNKGFGFIHDGSFENLFVFLQAPVFIFNGGNPDQQRRDVEAFLLSFPSGTHAGVGTQTTVLNGAAVPGPQQALIDQMISLANSNAVGLIVKGRQGGIARGYSYIGGNNFQSDRNAEVLSAATLLAAAAGGSELTYTLVPEGSETRIGIDRDQDGFLDRDELDACADPADPKSVPGGSLCLADIAPENGDGMVNVVDLLGVIAQWGGGAGSTGDIAPGCGDGIVNVTDLLAVISQWGTCP
ncbi:MAG: hypothetical protein L0Y44_10550 [Phycisphaerales bacterium]|nr:hypothetical protein [Phycisphaerales bacterium]